MHAFLCVFLWETAFHRVSESVSKVCLQGCQRRFKIFSLLSAPTHFSLCTAAQICKSTLLRMQSTRSASIYSILLSPSRCTHPPSLPLILVLLSLVFLFGLSCSVHGICPRWGIIERWKAFFWAGFNLNLYKSIFLFNRVQKVKDCLSVCICLLILCSV